MPGKSARCILGLLFCLALPVAATAQEAPPVHASNSYWLPNKGMIRIFLVFAETADDPIDTLPGGPAWPKGMMPADPGAFFDHQPLPQGKMKGYLTKYFHAASFGEYTVLGDYYPELLRIPHNKLRRNGLDNIVEKLNLEQGSVIRTAHGYSTSGSDFDNWTIPRTAGHPKVNQPDGFIDAIVVIWRVNSSVQKVDNSGHIFLSTLNLSLKSKSGFNAYSQFISANANAYDILKHEYSHSLYGGNNFHNGGAGAGQRTFMSSMAGYSNMNSWDHSLDSWNGWDRHRMGWKHPSGKYLPGALDKNGSAEIPSDISIATHPAGAEFVLRDFSTWGDAVRIRLPHLRKPVYSQYLWLEYHSLEKEFDVNGRLDPGVLAYIQVGKDNPESFDEPGNYTTPFVASGNYDFLFHREGQESVIERVEENANPFTGYHYLMRQAIDQNGDGRIENELNNSSVMMVDGERRIHYPCFGNRDDAFSPRANNLIALDRNPAPVPVYTKATPSYGVQSVHDNQAIYINGLRIEFLPFEGGGEGKVLIRIGWDSYNVERDVRWCGKIVIQNDKDDPRGRETAVEVTGGAQVLVDQGLTPQKPVGVRQPDGSFLFADPSVLILRDGGKLSLLKRASLQLTNGSTLQVNTGGELILHHGSGITAGAESIALKGGVVTIRKKNDQLMISEQKILDMLNLQKVKYRKISKAAIRAKAG